MITEKTTTLSIWMFVDKVMLLLFNMLSKSVKPFFPRSKDLLISWLQSLSAVILEPKKIKSITVSPEYGSKYYLQPLRRNWRSLALLNDYYYYFVLFDSVILRLHFLTSLTKFILCCFLQIKGRQRTFQGRTIGSCFISESCLALSSWNIHI